MNFKKIVSAVSALAISVSAFAGLAVTASAAGETYDIVFGTPIETDGVVTGVTPQTDFTTDAAEKEASTKTYVITGTALLGNQAGGRAYNFTNPITSGEVHLSAYALYVGGNYNFWSLQGLDEQGNPVDVVLSPYALPSGSGETTVMRYHNGTGTTNVTAGYVYTPRNVVYSMDITVNLTTRKILYDLGYASKGSSGTVSATSTVSGTVDLPADVVSVTGWNLPRLGSSGNNFYDSVALYAVIPPAGTHTYTVNAVDGNGSVIQQLAYDTATEGDTYSVSGLPEVIVKDGAYYQLSSSVTNHTATFTMGDADATETVTYIEDSSIVAYIEGESMAAQHSSYSAVYEDVAYSNGQARTTQGNAGEKIYKSITLADGIYTFVVGQGARASRKNEPYAGNIMLGDDIVVGSMNGVISGTTVDTFTDITVNAGTYELRAAVTNSAISPVDYIIIKKTADIPAPAAPSVSATPGNKAQGGTNYMTFDATPADVATEDITDCGFAFINTATLTEAGNTIVWQKSTKRENGSFGTAIAQMAGAEDSTIYAIPFIVGNSFAKLGEAVKSVFVK